MFFVWFFSCVDLGLGSVCIIYGAAIENKRHFFGLIVLHLVLISCIILQKCPRICWLISFIIFHSRICWSWSPTGLTQLDSRRRTFCSTIFHAWILLFSTPGFADWYLSFFTPGSADCGRPLDSRSSNPGGEPFVPLFSMLESFHLPLQDLLIVIAHGTHAARLPAANLLFHYFPCLNPSLFDKRGIHYKYMGKSS